MTNTYNLLGDLYKDVCGFRPSQDFLQAFAARTDVEQATEWDSLCKALADREATDRTEEQRCLQIFETRIHSMVADFNIDEATAIRWDMDAMMFAINFEGDVTQEIEFYLWKQGIAPSAWSRFVNLITNEITTIT
jgi:hypothetical protein